MISPPLLSSLTMDDCEEKITTTIEISTPMMTFLITTTVSKTEVMRGRAQVRENPSRLMGDPADGYRIENEAPAMTVT